jgi:YVTN family beta-propeller protein
VATARTAPAAGGKPPPVFVLNSLDATISVIDPATWTETARIPTGKEPHHLYLTPDEKSLVVANALGDSLTFVDPRTAAVQRVIRDIVDPYHLRFSPDMKWFVTAANRLNHVDIYRWDGSNPQLVKRIPTGKTPSHLWIDAKSTTLYSTMQDSDELVAIDLATQTSSGACPPAPCRPTCTAALTASSVHRPDRRRRRGGVHITGATATPAKRVGRSPRPRARTPSRWATAATCW